VPVRHSFAVSAVVATLGLFALANGGRATQTASVHAIADLPATAANRAQQMRLELFDPSGIVDMRRAVRDETSGAQDLREHGDDARAFSARVTVGAAGIDAPPAEQAECAWTDARRTSAECVMPSDGRTLVLTVVRQSNPTRSVKLSLTLPATELADADLELPLRLTTRLR
jgi:hypothetical protein